MKYVLLTLFVCLALFSCKKKEPPLPVNGSPVFKFIGTIGGDSVNYQAGVDRMYMYTGFYKDPQSLMTIKSYFAKDDCSNCEPYLSFEVKDFDVTNTDGLAGTIADLIKGGGTFNSYSLDSILTTTTVEIFKFLPSVTNASATYKWDFGDSTTSTLMSPNHIFSGGLRNIRLIIQAGGSVPDTLVNQINTDFNSTCRSQFTLFSDSMSNLVYVTANPSGGFSYLWDFGDGHFGQSAGDSNMYATGGKYLITLTSTGPPPSACTSIYKQKVAFTSFPFTLANFNYLTSDSTITSVIPRLNKSAFVITWKKNGKEYRSYKNTSGVNQSGNPVFTFTGVTPYSKDAAGHSTIMVTGTVDTYLYNVANAQDSIKIKSDNIVLAGAYPD